MPEREGRPTAIEEPDQTLIESLDQEERPARRPTLPELHRPKKLSEHIGRIRDLSQIRLAGIRDPEVVLRISDFLKERDGSFYRDPKQFRSLDQIGRDSDLMAILDMVWPKPDQGQKRFNGYAGEHVKLLTEVSSHHLSPTLRLLMEKVIRYPVHSWLSDDDQARIVRDLEQLAQDDDLGRWLIDPKSSEVIGQANQLMGGFGLFNLKELRALYQLDQKPVFRQFLKEGGDLGSIRLSELAEQTAIFDHPDLLPVLREMRSFGYQFGPYQSVREFSQLLNQTDLRQRLFSRSAKILAEGLSERGLNLDLEQASALGWWHDQPERVFKAVDLVRQYQLPGDFDLKYGTLSQVIQDESTLQSLEDPATLVFAEAIRRLPQVAALESYEVHDFLTILRSSQVKETIDSPAGQEFFRQLGQGRLRVPELVVLPDLLKIPGATEIVAAAKDQEIALDLTRDLEAIQRLAADPTTVPTLRDQRLPKLLKEIRQQPLFQNRLSVQDTPALFRLLTDPATRTRFFNPRTQAVFGRLHESIGLSGLDEALAVLPNLAKFEEVAGYYHSSRLASDPLIRQRELANLDWLAKQKDWRLVVHRLWNREQEIWSALNRPTGSDLRYLDILLDLSDSQIRILSDLSQAFKNSKFIIDPYDIPRLLDLPADRLQTVASQIKRYVYHFNIDPRLTSATLIQLAEFNPAIWDKLADFDQRFGSRYQPAWQSHDTQAFLLDLPLLNARLDQLLEYEQLAARITELAEQQRYWGYYLPNPMNDVTDLIQIDRELLEQLVTVGYLPQKSDRSVLRELGSALPVDMMDKLSELRGQAGVGFKINIQHILGLKVVADHQLFDRLPAIESSWQGSGLNNLTAEALRALGRVQDPQLIDWLTDERIKTLLNHFEAEERSLLAKTLWQRLSDQPTQAGTILRHLSQPVVLEGFDQFKDKHSTTALAILWPQLCSEQSTAVYQAITDRDLQALIDRVPDEFGGQGALWSLIIRQADQHKRAVELLQTPSLTSLLDDGQTARVAQAFLNRALNQPKDYETILSVAQAAPELVAEPLLHDFLFGNLDKLKAIPPERLKEYIEVSLKIEHSPSQEVQRIREQLLAEIVRTPDPIAAYQQIEAVFIRNNLPTVGKIFLVFSILHPQKILDEKLAQQHLSPVLRAQSFRGRIWTIYRDLLNVHLRSGNRSLQSYLEILRDGEALLDRVETVGFDQLSPVEADQLGYFFDRLGTLFIRSQLGRQAAPLPETRNAALAERADALRRNLRVRTGQTLTERISEIFLKPIGLERLDQAFQVMRESKEQASARNLALVNSAAREDLADGRQATVLALKAGDLVKGVNSAYITAILQNGSVAKEYLGASADSDSTPFDTDVGLVLPDDIQGQTPTDRFRHAFAHSPARNYGDLRIAVRARGQWQMTTPETAASYDPTKLELFNSGVAGQGHYGIRTGFPATEIAFFIAPESFLNDRIRFDNLCFEIAQNGYYLPIVTEDGRLIFTPDDYARYRKVFDGLERFDAGPIDFAAIPTGHPLRSELDQVLADLEQDRAPLGELSSQIQGLVGQVLKEQFEIELKSAFDPGLLGAELVDTGSTARATNIPGSYDFDLVLKLDDADFRRLDQIAQGLRQRLAPERDQSHPESSYYQIRAFGSQAFGGRSVDVDIGISPKSELTAYGSHDAVQEKLTSIRTNFGEPAFKETLANIVLAKKLLTAGQAYKRVEHGGWGGIGVENWILANRGNLLEACQTFRQAAYDGAQPVPLEVFKDRYKVLDAGVNLKHRYHDNYTANLTPQGYAAMRRVVEQVLEQ